MQMVNIQVEFGEPAILPCNGSAYLDEKLDLNVQWEAMGQDVAILSEGGLSVGDQFEGRVLLHSEEKLWEGDWSVVLEHTILSDTDMYECILQGRKTISTVWLEVVAPHVERSQVVFEGATVYLPCFIPISRNQSPNDLQVWWTRNGSTIESTTKEALIPTTLVYNSDRVALLDYTKGELYLHIDSTVMSDNGEYSCLYKTRDSDDPKPGIPESIILVVLETTPAEFVSHPDETATAATATEDWLNTTHEFAITWTEEVTDVETTESPLIPVFLEDSTQPIKVMTESQPMEAFEETVTSFPDEDPPETSTESSQWDNLPWVRIVLIAGVLLVTTVVLCILGARGKI
ncbi:uncharacterized protein LOC109139869 isoform X2 [Larimichthys crocea]|nr:uncharacterized protein LOC109139869 isoform X2 [Larimichthys crocea]